MKLVYLNQDKISSGTDHILSLIEKEKKMKPTPLLDRTIECAEKDKRIEELEKRIKKLENRLEEQRSTFLEYMKLKQEKIEDYRVKYGNSNYKFKVQIDAKSMTINNLNHKIEELTNKLKELDKFRSFHNSLKEFLEG